MAHCRPEYRPRLYAHDWLEELYHEAACAACEVQRSYDPAKGSLYAWGMRVIGQRLRRFCDAVWMHSKCECEYPCSDDEDGEFELVDEGAYETMLETVLRAQVHAALACLTAQARAVVELHYGEETLSERAIAQRLGKSKTWVRQRIESVLEKLRRRLSQNR
ncbi:MAG: sigma-70 family RNA polymerase sigma factor [Fimbriimonadales bacterium]|nr:sigma-70 family RNA polymerase sigma factor [Fimbriimonadales bacterium]